MKKKFGICIVSLLLVIGCSIQPQIVQAGLGSHGYRYYEGGSTSSGRVLNQLTSGSPYNGCRVTTWKKLGTDGRPESNYTQWWLDWTYSSGYLSIRTAAKPEYAINIYRSGVPELNILKVSDNVFSDYAFVEERAPGYSNNAFFYAKAGGAIKENRAITRTSTKALNDPNSGYIVKWQVYNKASNQIWHKVSY